MTQQEWVAEITWTDPGDITTTQAERLTQALPGFGIVVHEEGARLRAQMTVQAATARAACEAAIRAARAAYTQATGAWAEPVDVHVLTLPEHERVTARPDPADLVGLVEAADILGISPQRVDQLWRTNPRFPAPIAQLAAGVVFTRASIDAVKEAGWQRPPGRPRKVAG